MEMIVLLALSGTNSSCPSVTHVVPKTQMDAVAGDFPERTESQACEVRHLAAVHDLCDDTNSDVPHGCVSCIPTPCVFPLQLIAAPAPRAH